MPQYTYIHVSNEHLFVYNFQKVFQAIKRIHLDAQLDSMLNCISNFFGMITLFYSHLFIVYCHGKYLLTSF